jgi:hypothetical protein
VIADICRYKPKTPAPGSEEQARTVAARQKKRRVSAAGKSL